MADLTAEEIKALQEKAARLEEENKELKETLDTADFKSPVIKGTFRYKNKPYRFKNGAVNTRLQDGQLVPTEKLLVLANNKKVTPEDVLTYPALAQIANSDGSPKDTIAKDYVTHLIEIGYGLIEKKTS